jgi:hypothetical protein
MQACISHGVWAVAAEIAWRVQHRGSITGQVESRP